MATSRRRARALALQALYEMDVGGHSSAESLDRLLLEAGMDDQSSDFARELLSGVLERLTEIDSLIQQTATAWPAKELAAIDRNILRIAIREFMIDNLTPVGAAVNEAVELAKSYGTESSGKLINGVLGSLGSAAKAQEGQ